jgi:alkylation response protein AidB-like acyl-CoA dehydrogenase
MSRDIYAAEHDDFRAVVREFLAREVAPQHDKWEADGIVDKAIYAAAADRGLLGFWVPEEYGGLGITDYRYNAIVLEETGRSGLSAPAFRLYNDIIAPYLMRLTTPEQKARWLPGQAKGTLTFAIAMTEPGAGSDLAGTQTTAKADGDDFILNGQKTFISNGYNCDAVIVAAKTDPAAGHRGFSLLVVEDGMPGFERGRRLKKAGMHGQDTSELFFADVRVPRANLIGTEGRGFYHLMENLALERLSVTIASLAQARQVFADTLEYTKTRTAFGQPIGSFQANKFTLAELDTELDIAQVYVDECIRQVMTGTLDATVAAKAKWWVTELTTKTVDRCVQLHGSYGYMLEYPVTKAWLDTRIQTIYAGSTEIMKEIIGKKLGL